MTLPGPSRTVIVEPVKAPPVQRPAPPERPAPPPAPAPPPPERVPARAAG